MVCGCGLLGSGGGGALLGRGGEGGLLGRGVPSSVYPSFMYNISSASVILWDKDNVLPYVLFIRHYCTSVSFIMYYCIMHCVHGLYVHVQYIVEYKNGFVV